MTVTENLNGIQSPIPQPVRVICDEIFLLGRMPSLDREKMMNPHMIKNLYPHIFGVIPRTLTLFGMPIFLMLPIVAMNW